MRYLFNVPIITNYGTFGYRKSSFDEAKAFVEKPGWTSAIGHEGTARFLSAVLGIEIAVNRKTVRMGPGDEALVLRMLERVPEGTVFRTIDEISRWPHEFGILRMFQAEGGNGQ